MNITLGLWLIPAAATVWWAVYAWMESESGGYAAGLGGVFALIPTLAVWVVYLVVRLVTGIT